MASFHWADYLVFVITLLISMGVGVYFAIKGRKKDSKEDFLMGNRNIPILPVAASIFVSYMSSISFLADPVESYSYGFIYILMPIGYILAVPMLAFFICPEFHKMNIISVFEYLENRYNKTFRYVSSFVSGVATLLWMSIAIFTTSIALSQVCNLSVWASTVLTGCVATFYTVLGGMKAVVWADTLQLLIIVAGQLAILIQVTINQGGMAEIFSIAREGGRINFRDTWSEFNPLSRAAFWVYLIGGFFRVMTEMCSCQLVMQRFSTVKTPRDSTLAMLANMPVFLFINGVLGLNGLMLYAHYRGCDPLLSGRIEMRDQMIPLLVMDTLGYLPGIPGLYLATIYSAALSSVSSALNGLSSTCLADVIDPIYRYWSKRRLSAKAEVVIAKILVVVLGVSIIGFALVVASAGKSSFAMVTTLVGMCAGPIASLFILGICFPWIKPMFAEIGFAVSVLFTLSLTVASFCLPPRPPWEFLPISTSGCPANNNTMDSLTGPMTSPASHYMRSTTLNSVTISGDEAGLDMSGFRWDHLHQLSPLWFAVFGLSLTFVISGTLQGIYYIYSKVVQRTARGQKDMEEKEEKDVQLHLMNARTGKEELDKPTKIFVTP